MTPTTMPPVSEREFQRTVVEFAHALNWRVMHINDSRREVAQQDGARFLVGDKETTGWPDLTLVRERIVFAELKAESGRLTKGQLEWLGVLDAAGQETYVWRPSAWKEIHRVLTRRTRP